MDARSLWRGFTSAIALIVSLVAARTPAAGADATGATRPAAVDDRSTPRAAMRTLVDAIGRADADAIAASVFVADDPERSFATAYARVLVAEQRYWLAAWERWGRQASIEAYVRRGRRLPDAYLDYPRAEWERDGDRAIRKHVPTAAAAKGKGAPSPLRNVDGQWLHEPLGRAGRKEIAAAVARLDESTALLTRLAAEIAAGKFASVHDAIDVLFPRERAAQAEPEPELDKRQLDPKTIPGAMTSLGQAYVERDARAAAGFYHVDGPAGAAARLAEAHARWVLAAHDFTQAVAHDVGATESLAMEFGLIDERDDLFGHLITEWTIKGDRATGSNNAGPAAATMRRVGGVWKIDLTPPAGAPPDKRAAELRRQTNIVRAITLDVREKRLFTVEEVRAALKQRGLVAVAPGNGGEVEE